ncbi:HNH endonuclease [Microbacterium sp. EYE_5]|uniref:HNH endonuclease signature motif containing protein n=1 Tax=unclassified Microbacterium TaxID=2609290 RepID=UPI0020055974|nr:MULTISPECIES: HNH endonuclease signature motif containing protein [unclassified Microbacterium]MCK6079033.1 HNH endonuclease [Microbacterium sp. EYE_382]MCK6084303.1 HNH endonuclease [Microbacterium sp. EYE_384]MCK6123468.1 HNH endonuclease [Microbacterium sp. EYE_80]MCK6125067.1 HNH endonuclease [Microbacterium sp. EYE_79]MCK6139987.1 HNH endonuclease [Microbacterium sp. EYE_39]
MTFSSDLRDRMAALGAVAELDVARAELPGSLLSLSDAAVRDLIADVGALARDVGLLQTALAGVAARRSGRERGAEGLSAATGHRTPVELIQATTGVSRAEATRAVRVGESLLDGVERGPVVAVWHAAVDAALLAGRVTSAQAHAIMGGLGEPPAAAVADAWGAAAERLVREASDWSVEQLTAQARTLRDMLDPAGAEDRFARRFERRSFRLWADADGQQRGSITFDDEMAPWMRAVLDAALRPRRGGPRFMTDAERADAAALVDDQRTNEQLSYDLLVDLVRAGALADAKDVFGAREPGVRVVVTAGGGRDLLGRLGATGAVEDGGTAVPGSVIDRAQCVAGRVEVTVDGCGNPLAVGRDERLFSRRQRLALAVRDGGCLWPGCERPPSHCEAHHTVPWAEGGETDCDVGVLLCRFHHLTLHNGGWSIRGTATSGFFLHAPPGGDGGRGDGAAGGAATGGAPPVPLRSKSPLRWLWDPPPDRVGWRVAPAA